MTDVLIYFALWIAMALAAAWWFIARQRQEAKEIAAELAAERARQAKLETEYRRACSLAANLTAAVERARKNKKAYLALQVKANSAYRTARETRQALYGEAA